MLGVHLVLVTQHMWFTITIKTIELVNLNTIFSVVLTIDYLHRVMSRKPTMSVITMFHIHMSTFLFEISHVLFRSHA